MRVAGFFAPLGTSMPDGVDRLKNLYREDTGDPDRPYRFVRRPGHRAFCTGLNGPVRGGIEIDGALYVIAGTKFYSVNGDGVSTEIDDVEDDGKKAYFIANGTAGNQVAASSGGKLYRYNTNTGNFTQVTDADLLSGGPIAGVVHTDLYAVAWFENSRAFKISALADFTSWDTADVAERSQYIDNIAAIVADQKELWLLGSQTFEVYWDSGNADFPFEPVPNALGRVGTVAADSAILVGDTPYWVQKTPDGRGSVVRARGGYNAERISTHWVERRIQSLTPMASAYAYAYEEAGHRFYVLTFPSADVTLAFDEAVDPLVAWSEWSYRNTYTGFNEATLGRCHIFAYGKHLVGSRRDGTIYEQTLSAYDDAGTPIIAQRRFRGPRNDGRRVFISEARLDANVGVGLTSGQGSDPQVMLRKSKDGGRTWGIEQWRSLGHIGQYGTRVRWQRQGYADDPAWDVSYSDPTILGLNDFHVEAMGGAH